ncbi:hypothetical protein [Actinomycetospora succinea]|uniref:hypothetical protein n=1 Tax=Actinomycetospora succinea TaxID=663603 RepID=UPI00105F040F|nr:hypothetical protein [Actinomycetospora succinea]
MSDVSPLIEGASIVLAGSMNPGIFHPQWLARNDLIRVAEAESAENVVVTPEFARFEVEWFTVEVLPERLTVLTQSSPFYSSLRDLVFSIVKLLPHTPVDAIGLNRSAHFGLSSSDVYDKLGHRLAPKDMWREVLDRPGMRRVSIQGERTDGKLGMVLVSVEPSVQVHNGLFIDVNDHFVRGDATGADFDAWIEDVFTSCWKTHLSSVHNIQSKILEYAEESSQ